MGLHAGQLRYHDFTKLREIYAERKRKEQQQLLQQVGGVRFFRTELYNGALSKSLSSLPLPSLTEDSRRTFIGGYMTQMNLKRLERQSNVMPEDAEAHAAFLRELIQQYPSVVLERFQSPAYQHVAINADCAMIYLYALLQSRGNMGDFNPQQLVQRLQKSGEVVSPALLQWAQEWTMEKKQMSVTERAQTVLHFLQQQTPSSGLVGAGTAAAGATLTGAAGSPASSGINMLSRGADPKFPVHVEVHQPTNARAAILGFLGRTVLLLVAVSAVGALLDEKGLGKAVGINSSTKHIQEAEQTVKVRFEDVKGVDEAKHELEEIVSYLRDPNQFTRLGGKLPRGVLLTGPPGTGKTLLAKAIAGEADVPFFFSSGSQFEEVYVGLGAKRVRELFDAAKKKSPAIIFIDEIDAIGGTRRLKDQSALKMTLNELLVQLDGFDENNGIIVIGATNFIESLDAALLRPGRFDKHVTVPLPDVGGRKEILEMYAKKTKLHPDVDLTVLARGTTGFSGADLYNLMNQAALKASVDGLNSITMAILEYAKDKILMGAERKTAVITKETARCTAYHEAGHALVALMTKGSMPIHKATIMPRGQSLGMVTMLPEGDQSSQSLKEMYAIMDVCMGGRVAEEIIFGKEEVTSGASSDIVSATRIARAMVTKYGFSEEVGVVYHSDEGGSVSEETRARIDAEVKRLLDDSYQRAKHLLTKHARQHQLLAQTLLEYETLTGDEVRSLVFKGIKPKRPIINKNGGARGDPSMLNDKGIVGGKTRLGREQQ